MVNIYLCIGAQQVLALSIPSGDIERLAIRPLKWLRFVTCAFCGAHGDLSATPNGLPVDYNSIHINHIAGAYYYIPDGDYHFIDYHGMNNRINSQHTSHSSGFRAEVMARDGPVCVFTGISDEACDATHLLPQGKGNEYITFILQNRFHLYDAEREDLVINSVENGIFLNKNLHSSFGQGWSAFLKTPNFALDPADIPRVEAGPMPTSRLTLQHLRPDTSRFPLPQCDARIACTGISSPSPIMLDFMYGLAAYHRWHSGEDIEKVMQDYFDKQYKSIPLPPAPPCASDSECDHSLKMSDGMLRAMDHALAFSMLLNRTTPELMAAERLKREEAEELLAMKASRVKVDHWMSHLPPVEADLWEEEGGLLPLVATTSEG